MFICNTTMFINIFRYLPTSICRLNYEFGDYLYSTGLFNDINILYFVLSAEVLAGFQILPTAKLNYLPITNR